MSSQRNAIIDAALNSYRDGGFAAVSFRRVAQAVGISHMQPYRYFSDKQALMAAMRARCFEHLITLIKAAHQPHQTPLQALYSITAGTFGYLFEHPQQYRLMFSLNQPPVDQYPELKAVREQVYQHIKQLIADAVAVGEMHGDPDEIMHLAWAMSHGLYTLHISHQLMHGKTLEQLIQPAMATIFAPLTHSDDLDALQRAAQPPEKQQ